MATPFLDYRVLLRHLLYDVPEHSSRATAYLRQIEEGTRKVRLTDTALVEAVFTLEHCYHVPKPDIAAVLEPLIALPGIVLAHKSRFRAVFDAYVNRNISFGDAYQVVLMQCLASPEVVTFDREFGRAPGILCLEPQPR
jgi:predicted nucleic-acid-binding protein